MFVRVIPLLALAATACGAGKAAPGGASTARSGPAAGPGPGGSPPVAARTLYRQGLPYVPRTVGDDREACWATADALAACQSMRADGPCQLEPPVGYWEGSVYCRGAAMTEADFAKQDMMRDGLTVPVCECSCAATFIAALRARQEQIYACSRVP